MHRVRVVGHDTQLLSELIERLERQDYCAQEVVCMLQSSGPSTPSWPGTAMIGVFVSRQIFTVSTEEVSALERWPPPIVFLPSPKYHRDVRDGAFE